jgi:hypothetical protein
MPDPQQQDPQQQAAFNDELQETNDLLKDTSDIVDTLRNDFLGIGSAIENELKAKIKDLKGDTKKVAQTISNDIAKGFRKLRMDSSDLVDLTKKQLAGSLKIKDVNSAIETIKSNHATLENSIKESISEGVMSEAEGKDLLETILKRKKTQLALAKQLADEAERQEKALGITYKIFDGIAKIPILNSLIKIEKVKEAMEGAAANTNSAWGVFRKGVAASFQQIGKSLKDPLIILGLQVALFKKIFDINKDINERQVAQQKSLGISYDQSQKLAQSTFEYANATNDVFVTEKRLTEGRTKLNELLGTSVVYTNQSVEGFERLTHYYGVSEESAANLTELATQQGVSTKDILGSTIRTANEQKRQFGGTISYQKVLQKVSSTGGEILTKFKGNTQELAKAVMQADRLGLNLDQVNKIGESILDFESSIENELKAELLTGKQINLERARAAALSGDLSKLTTEIAKQTGGIAQFQKMNAIQQKAYAEAFGMTTAEMGDMLRKREFEAKLGADAKKSAEEQLRLADERGIKIDESIRKDLEAKTLADKQKYVFEKIAEIIGRITAGPMGKFMKMLESALGFVEKIFSFLGKLTGGVLGDALGAAIIGAPLLIGLTKMLIGGAKNLFFGKPSGRSGDPVHTTQDGGGGLTDMFSGKGPFGKLMGKGGFGRGKNMTLGKSLMKGAKGFGIGSAIGIGADLVADQMDEGAGKDTVSGIGTVASYAGTGAMIGSIIPGVGTAIGAGVGAIAGAIKGLFDAETNKREREEKAKQQREDQQKKTNELLSQFLDRPVQLNVGGKTILDFNTASNLYGNQQSSF